MVAVELAVDDAVLAVVEVDVVLEVAVLSTVLSVFWDTVEETTDSVVVELDFVEVFILQFVEVSHEQLVALQELPPRSLLPEEEETAQYIPCTTPYTLLWAKVESIAL